MRRKYLTFFLIPSILLGCGIWKKITFTVVNKFPLVEEPSNSNFEIWKDENLYILRVELKEEKKVTYKENDVLISIITDYDFKDYRLLTKPDWDNRDVVEEVYLYLNDLDNDASSGSALYMSSLPLLPKTSQLIFSNNYFISTFGLNHVMTGEWSKKNDSLINVTLGNKKNILNLKGILKTERKNEMIEFTHVNHPKPMDKESKRFIMFKEIFDITSNIENEANSNILGVRFFQNTKRTFMHPNWRELGANFDYEVSSKYYFENTERRKITKFMIGKNEEHEVYFEINDPALKSPKNNIIGYRK